MISGLNFISTPETTVGIVLISMITGFNCQLITLPNITNVNITIPKVNHPDKYRGLSGQDATLLLLSSLVGIRLSW